MIAFVLGIVLKSQELNINSDKYYKRVSLFNISLFNLEMMLFLDF